MTNKEAREELKYIKESFAQNALSYEALDLADTALKVMELLMDGNIPYTIMQEWIPVSERLPEDGQKVLVTTRSGNIIDIDTSIFYHASAFWKHYVIAWMPLPQPYKEGEKDEINNS